MAHRPTIAARAFAALTIGAVALSFTACAATPAPTPSTSQGATTVDPFESLYDAVSASDPRVEDPLGTMSRSGANRVLSLSVLISGDEPVSTETLTAILVAVDGSPMEFDQLDLNARSAADSEQVLDLSPAIAGLPADVTPLALDSGLTIMRSDLQKLAA